MPPGVRARLELDTRLNDSSLELSAELWSLLVGQLDYSSPEQAPTRLTVAIDGAGRPSVARRQANRAHKSRTFLQTVVCNARRAHKGEFNVSVLPVDMHLSELHDDPWGDRADFRLHLNCQRCVVYCPPSLVDVIAQVVGGRPSAAPHGEQDDAGRQVNVSLTRTIHLDSVILVADSVDAYSRSQTDSAALERAWADSGEILRQGSKVGVDGSTWTVVMAEPVLQGIVKPSKTSFVVLPPPTGPTDHGQERQLSDADGEDKASIGSTDDDSESSDEFDIDEAFLAPSVLTPPGPQSRLTTPVSSPPARSSVALTNGFALDADTAGGAASDKLVNGGYAPRPSRKLLVFPKALQDAVQYSALTPDPPKDEDDLLRVYLKTRDLGRLGLFSGDWVTISSERNAQAQRLVRVFAADDIVYEGDGPNDLLVAWLPPVLLHNLKLSPQEHLVLAPSRLGLPSFPTAQSVTVARIASPHSVNRLYQPLFLRGLKEYFQFKKRVLKMGDILAVGICEDMLRFSEGKGEEDEIELPESSDAPTTVVYFQIISLEAPNQQNGFIPSTTAEEELRDQLDAGGLGCIVDPTVTKLLQTGIEHALVPDMCGFLSVVDGPTVDVDAAVKGTPAHRLHEYVQASLRPGAANYDLNLTVLIKGAHGAGKKTLVKSVAWRAGFHLLEASSGSSTKNQALETGQEPAMSTIVKECLASAQQGWKTSGYPVIVVGTTSDADKVSTGVLGAFKEEIAIDAPSEPERLAILKSLTASLNTAPDVSLRALAVQTAALVANDLVDLVRRASIAAADRVIRCTALDDVHFSLGDIKHAGVALTSVDFNAALDKARSSYSESIGAPKIPNVTWDDVGGLANVKSDILDTIQLPLEHPELFADGLKKRSGILLYGPPGTGKTLLAKAVATSCSLNFFSVKGPELLNMYIGESEANVRRVFQRARDAKPCVIFFDELDSVAPKRGNQGDSGGVMDRIVSQLLAELDGMSEGKGGSDVFVIGATNRPDLLDPALLRPGRFDRMLYLGVSDNHDAQLKIIQALTRKFKLDPAIRLDLIAQQCPFNYTGADFYALCSDAMLKAMTRKASEIDKRIEEFNKQPPYNEGPALTPQYYLAELATPAEIEVLVSQEDFEAALAELVPSVSQAEMQHYKLVQQRFSTETMNSEDKMLQKQIEMPALSNPDGTTDVSLDNGRSERPEVLVNGHAALDESEPEPVLSKGKGKGKAVVDSSDLGNLVTSKAFKLDEPTLETSNAPSEGNLSGQSDVLVKVGEAVKPEVSIKPNVVVNGAHSSSNKKKKGKTRKQGD
ncbi:peroxisomal assembly protein [Microbotryomycetes sp. JL201]|nr:peroxisomal assembly protein [Microbotryomycetes sp. JL201]